MSAMFECDNCGALNPLKKGPCIGCKLSSPKRTEVPEPTGSWLPQLSKEIKDLSLAARAGKVKDGAVFGSITVLSTRAGTHGETILSWVSPSSTGTLTLPTDN